jgi:hypothetical protein
MIFEEKLVFIGVEKLADHLRDSDGFLFVPGTIFTLTLQVRGRIHIMKGNVSVRFDIRIPFHQQLAHVISGVKAVNMQQVYTVS